MLVLLSFFNFTFQIFMRLLPMPPTKGFVATALIPGVSILVFFLFSYSISVNLLRPSKASLLPILLLRSCSISISLFFLCHFLELHVLHIRRRAYLGVMHISFGRWSHPTMNKIIIKEVDTKTFTFNFKFPLLFQRVFSTQLLCTTFPHTMAMLAHTLLAPWAMFFYRTYEWRNESMLSYLYESNKW